MENKSTKKAINVLETRKKILMQLAVRWAKNCKDFLSDVNTC